MESVFKMSGSINTCKEGTEVIHVKGDLEVQDPKEYTSRQNIFVVAFPMKQKVHQLLPSWGVFLEDKEMYKETKKNIGACRQKG